MAEESANRVEATENVIELTESRKGVFFQTEVGLPEGFEPPSAALTLPPVVAQLHAADLAPDPAETWSLSARLLCVSWVV